MLPDPEIAPKREDDKPETVPAEEQKQPELDPAHLGHGVHAHGDSETTGMHIGDSALPSSNRTGAGLGGLQIGDTRF